MPRFTVDCELAMHYGLIVIANDEDEAVEKAEELLEKIVEQQKIQPEDYSVEMGDADETNIAKVDKI